MNGASLRKVLRIIHFICAALLGTYVYSPWNNEPLFANFIMFGVIPLMTISGLLMWKQAAFMGWIRKSS